MFVIPGLLVATAEGFDAAVRRNPWSATAWVRASALGLGCFVLASAAPGGGRFRPQNFGFGRPLWRRELAGPPSPEGVSEAHAALAVIPASEGLALPFPIGAPYADRALILTMDQTTPHRAADSSLRWAARHPRGWPNRGRYLVERASFRMAAFAEPALVVLKRGSAAPLAEVPLPARASSACTRPLVVWPSAGIAACATESLPRRKPALVVTRIGPPDPTIGDAPLQMWLRPASGAPIELLAMRGVLNLRDLSTGPARLVPSEPIAAGPLTVVLTHEGRPLAARGKHGAASTDESSALQWPGGSWASP